MHDLTKLNRHTHSLQVCFFFSVVRNKISNKHMGTSATILRISLASLASFLDISVFAKTLEWWGKGCQHSLFAKVTLALCPACSQATSSYNWWHNSRTILCRYRHVPTPRRLEDSRWHKQKRTPKDVSLMGLHVYYTIGLRFLRLELHIISL